MADVASIHPIWQLAGTLLTVLGGCAVAWIARSGPKRGRVLSIAEPNELKGIHTDIILLLEAVSGLKVLLLDYWQWARDREASARERHEWLKENVK